MEKFNIASIFDPKLSEWTGKYQETNPISKTLIKHFFKGIERAIKKANFSKEDKLIELGCGPGLSSLRIQKLLNGQHFEISDIDENVISMFDEVDFPIPYRHESILELNRNNSEFNGIFLLEVLEHIDNYKKVLSEIFRVSSKYVIVSTPNEPLWRVLNILRGKYINALGNTPGHVNHWSTSQLSQLISEYGEIVEIYRPVPWTIILAKKNEITLDLE